MRKRRNLYFQILLYAGFAVYVVILFMILFKMGQRRYQSRSINLIPFRGIASFLTGRDFVSGEESDMILKTFAPVNLLGNIIIFVPLGVYIALFNKGRRVLRNTLIIFAISVLVEVVQVILRLGIGDIDDVILNVIGGIIGILFCRLLFRLFKKYRKVRNIIAVSAPIAGALIYAVLFIYNVKRY